MRHATGSEWLSAVTPWLSRRGVLGLGAAVAAATTLGGCKVVKSTDATISSSGLTKQAAPGRRVNIEVYSIWAGPLGQGFVKLATAFEKTQSDIGVAVTYAPSAGNQQAKLLTGIASGNPPDVGMIVPQDTGQWSALGIMTDLTTQARASGTTGAGLIGPSWSSMNVGGRTWGMQVEADPNFPLFYNKTLFEAAGLDPDKPPQTIADVDAVSAKVLKKSGSQVVRAGMVPWTAYGFSNSFYTWALSYGAEFVDTTAQKVTMTGKASVDALQWMVDFARHLGGAANVSISPPSLQGSPFNAGNLAMAPLVASDLAALVAAKPTFTFGSCLLPYGPGGGAPGKGAWLGGWSLFVPRGSKHPDEAWEYIRWACATNDGSDLMYRTTDFLPLLASSPAFAEIDANPLVKPYHTALRAITKTRPAIPVANFLGAQLDTEVAKAVYGQESVRQALGNVERATNNEWDRFRRQVGNGEESS